MNPGVPKYRTNLTARWGTLLLILSCLIFMAGELINHRFWLSDFEVYYKAAQRLLAGENLYRRAEDAHYVFKYSPASAVFFMPFLLVPFAVAKYIYWLLLTGIIAFTINLSLRLVSPGILDRPRFANTVTALAGLTLAVHFMRELHLGQVNYLLLFLFTVAFSLYMKNRRVAFALVLACSLLIKPFALIFLPYLVLKRRYPEFLLILLFFLFLLILPLPFYGSPEFTLDQYKLWGYEIMTELGNKQNLLAGSNDTVFSVFARYTPLRYLVGDPVIRHLYQFTLIVIIALFVYHFIDLGRRGANSGRYENATEEFALLTALIPLLSFTSENAFLFTQLLVVILMIRFPGMKTWEKIICVMAFLFIGGNFGELWGRYLSKVISDISLITFGALFLVFILYQLRREDARSPRNLS